MTTTEARWRTVAPRALDDMEACSEEYSAALNALTDAHRRGATPDEYWQLVSGPNGLEHGVVRWRDGSMDAVCRVVGAHLLEHGHAECWRALYLVLLLHFDIGPGWDDGYGLGDEVLFVEEAGWRERGEPYGYDDKGEKKKAG